MSAFPALGMGIYRICRRGLSNGKYKRPDRPAMQCLWAAYLRWLRRAPSEVETGRGFTAGVASRVHSEDAEVRPVVRLTRLGEEYVTLPSRDRIALVVNMLRSRATSCEDVGRKAARDGKGRASGKYGRQANHLRDAADLLVEMEACLFPALAHEQPESVDAVGQRIEEPHLPTRVKA